MSISLVSNIAAMAISRELQQSTADAGDSMTRLGSGLRINRSSDDAAGLAIASTLRVESRIYGQATRNINDAVSALSIAESASRSLMDELIRLKELSEQSANGVLSTGQRGSLQKEADQLVNECNRIISTTNFNGLPLLSSAASALQIETGAGELLPVSPADDLQHLAPNGTFAPFQYHHQQSF